MVIENQLGKSDHDHLGKLLTYGSALDASAVVWIAGRLTEEHKKALDWLNDHTTEELSFYGVEVELWKIGDSSPAVRFNVISKPSEVERKTAIVAAKEGVTDAKRLQLEFWTEFEKRLRETHAVPSTQAPRPQYWYDVSLGRSGIHLSNFANTYENRVGLRVYLTSQIADQALDQLLKEKETIEKEIGAKLTWNPYPDKKDKTILLDRPAELEKRDRWPEYLNWLIDHNIKFRKAFGLRVKKLDLARNENKVDLDNL